jgi:hypothetical protein
VANRAPDTAIVDDSTALALTIALAGAGASGGELSYAALKEELTTTIRRDPFDATVATVLGGSFLFFMAEKGNNPKVETYWDALVFVSTCLSVGYADVFARTPAGKAIASAVMTLGPAMSAALLDGPAKEQGMKNAEAPAELVALQRVIVEKLDAILEQLKAASSSGK